MDTLPPPNLRALLDGADDSANHGVDLDAIVWTGEEYTLEQLLLKNGYYQPLSVIGYPVRDRTGESFAVYAVTEGYSEGYVFHLFADELEARRDARGLALNTPLGDAYAYELAGLGDRVDPAHEARLWIAQARAYYLVMAGRYPEHADDLRWAAQLLAEARWEPQDVSRVRLLASSADRFARPLRSATREIESFAWLARLPEREDRYSAPLWRAETGWVREALRHMADDLIDAFA